MTVTSGTRMKDPQKTGTASTQYAGLVTRPTIPPRRNGIIQPRAITNCVSTANTQAEFFGSSMGASLMSRCGATMDCPTVDNQARTKPRFRRSSQGITVPLVCSSSTPSAGPSTI